MRWLPLQILLAIYPNTKMKHPFQCRGRSGFESRDPRFGECIYDFRHRLTLRCHQWSSSSVSFCPAGGLHRGMEVEANRTQTPSIGKSMVGKSIVLHHHLEWGVCVSSWRWGDQRDNNWTGRLTSSAQHNSTLPYTPLHHKPGAQHNSTRLLGQTRALWIVRLVLVFSRGRRYRIPVV